MLMWFFFFSLLKMGLLVTGGRYSARLYNVVLKAKVKMLLVVYLL